MFCNDKQIKEWKDEELDTSLNPLIKIPGKDIIMPPAKDEVLDVPIVPIKPVEPTPTTTTDNKKPKKKINLLLLITGTYMIILGSITFIKKVRTWLF